MKKKRVRKRAAPVVASLRLVQRVTSNGYRLAIGDLATDDAGAWGVVTSVSKEHVQSAFPNPPTKRNAEQLSNRLYGAEGFETPKSAK